MGGRSSVGVAAAVAAALVVGCGDDDDPSSLTVLAASSLTDAFTEIADAYEAANPGIEVELSFAASSQIVAQVAAGAPADVVALADEATMRTLVERGDVDAPTAFASNAMTILVPTGNPAGIDGLGDLARDDVVLVVCAPEVPCGRYASEVLANAAVDASPRSYEENVRGVVGKVVLGEADAGIVYRTDALAAADDADEVAIPDDLAVPVVHSIAVAVGSDDREVATSFVELVAGDAGRTILDAYGFGVP